MYIFQIYFLGFLFSKPVPVLVEEKKGSKKDVAGKLALVYKWGKKVNIQTERITFIFTTKDVLLLFSPSRLLHLLHTLQIAFTTPSCRYCGSLLFLLLPWGNTERAKEKQQDHFWAFCVSHSCERTQVTLFSSFICMLGANLAMDLKTNHSYWFHCEFAISAMTKVIGEKVVL